MKSTLAQNLVKEYGSPLYVYDGNLIRTRCKEFKRAFPQLRLYYACKANTNPEIIRLIAEEGFGIETVSPGEIAAVRKAGVPPTRIAFTCSAINQRELVSIAKQGIRIHLDSLTQVEYFGKQFPGQKVSVRLNNGIGAGHHAHVITGGPDSKFGVDVTHLKELEKLAQKYKLKIAGLHQHIGSDIREPTVLVTAMDLLLDTALHFPDIEHLDFGGGFGVPYRLRENRLPVETLAKKVRARIHTFRIRYARHVEMSFEPGRYLVAEAGNLLVTVTDIKRNPTKTFVGVDSGMNHLVRPAMYNSYHEVENATQPDGKRELVTIAGNMCESGDVLAKSRFIPMPKIGHVLVIKTAGAYGYSMSSHYNQRPRPAEILLLKGEVRIIRKSG